MTYILTTAAQILHIDLFDEIQDCLGCITDFFSSVSSYLPENKFLRYAIYGVGTWTLFQASPYLLKNTSFFSYHYKTMEYFHRCSPHLIPQKMELLAELRNNEIDLPKLNNEKLVILEINAGGGCNLTYYPDGSHIIATDLDEAYEERIKQNFDEEKGESFMNNLTLNRFVNTCPEELMNIPDQAVSVVICIHSLCQARSLERAVSEIRRVLLPGGRFYFIEHVQEAKQFSYAWFRQMNYIVAFAFIECHVGRPTQNVIQNAGFSQVNIKYFRVDLSDFISPIQVLAPHIYGVCIK